jgi:tetratricopeptide (TPR) repeat protein
MQKLVRRYISALLLAFIFFGLRAARAEDATKLVIPDYPTAKDQYSFAVMYEKAQFVPPELAKKRVALQKVTQCYQRVIDLFPQDTTYTPRAYLSLGDCEGKLNEPDKAMQYYQYIINTFPTDEYLQARALFATAQMLDLKKQYEQAKTIYKEVMEKYGNSTNTGVRQITKSASVLYFQVHEQPAKSRWSLKGIFAKKDSQ